MTAVTRPLIAAQARRRRPIPRRIPRKPIEFSRLVKRIADQHGVKAAAAWTQSVLRHQAQIDLAALRSAIASKNVANIEAVVAASKLQQTAGRALREPFASAAQAAGSGSAAILKANGIAASFNVVHPNVVNFAREQAASMVVGIPAETKQVIAEVIALGAQHGLTVAEQARAIREVVGLPPPWAAAPVSLAREIRAGEAAAATSRRLSAAAKQQIRSKIAAGTVTDAFVNEMTAQYAASLINRRALNIARTETLRASHHGLTESWKQAQQQGVLPTTARRFWIVTPDDRLSPEHASIPGLNPNGRGMDEPFETTEGPYMYPPSRPNCRCSVGLLPNVPEGFDVTGGVVTEEAEPLPRLSGELTDQPNFADPEEFPLAGKGGLPLGRNNLWTDLEDPEYRAYVRERVASGTYTPDTAIPMQAARELEAIATQPRFVLQAPVEAHFGMQMSWAEIQASKSLTPTADIVRFRGLRTMGTDAARAVTYAGGEGAGTTFEVTVPAGSRMVSATVFDLPEYQMLPGSRFKVMEVLERPGGGTHVKLRLVDDGTKNTRAIVEFKKGLAELAGQPWEPLPTVTTRLPAGPASVVGASAAVDAEAQALYESAYGVIPRGRPMWSQLPEGRVRAKFLRKAEANIGAGTPGRLPPSVELRRTRILGEQPAPGAPVGDLPEPRIMEGTSRARVDLVHRDAVETLRGLNVDPGVLRYDSKLSASRQGERVLGGKKWTTVGQYKNGEIFVDPRVGAQRIRKHVAHEAMHLKFDVAMRTDPAIMKYVEANFRGLWLDDGVTEYSKSHWQQFMVKKPIRGTIPARMMTLPIEETLAEIQGEAVVGSARYKKLMQMVDDAYAKAQARGMAVPSARRSGLRSAVPTPELPEPPLRDLYRGETYKLPKASNGVDRTLSGHLDDTFADVPAASGFTEEAYAVDNYMSYHYGSINNALRSGNVEKHLAKIYSNDAKLMADRLKDIKGLDSVMARMPELGDNAVVWRSVNNVEWIAPGKGTFEVLENARALIGTEIRDGGYVSTTTLSGAARGWSEVARHGGTMIEIRLPPNTKGAWMKKIARHAQDNAVVKREYLLPRGARFKVVDARVEGGIQEKAILHIVVEYIP